MQPIFIKRKLVGKRSQPNCTNRSIGEHGIEETLTGHDGRREIDGFLIDVVGS